MNEQKLQKLLEELRRIHQEDDPEAGHINMDSALLEYINDKEVTELFRAFRKWYA